MVVTKEELNDLAKQVHTNPFLISCVGVVQGVAPMLSSLAALKSPELRINRLSGASVQSSNSSSSNSTDTTPPHSSSGPVALPSSPKSPMRAPNEMSHSTSPPSPKQSPKEKANEEVSPSTPPPLRLARDSVRSFFYRSLFSFRVRKCFCI
jgi:hypothetical protein